MAPTLSQVLSSGGTASAFNPVYFAAGLAVFLVAVLSVWYRRSQPLVSVIDEKPVLIDIHNREKIEKLSFMVNELEIEKQQMAAQNTDLQDQLMQTRVVLEKSNTALVRKSEELKAEREELALKASNPLVRTDSAARKKTIRKPVRVYRKKRK